jgi:hypothetical protein
MTQSEQGIRPVEYWGNLERFLIVWTLSNIHMMWGAAGYYPRGF